MSLPKKGLSELRKGRISVSGARYFVTVVTRERREGLAVFPFWAKLLELAARDEADVQALVVMPDHWHGLFILPEASEPSEVMRRLKGPCTPILREKGLNWQKNYFEHRLRPEEASEPYLRYMLSNPYRAGIAELDVRWPFWAITSPSAAWFLRKYPKQLPEPAWLALEKPWLIDDEASP